MHWNRFALSFVATLAWVLPLALGARDPRPTAVRLVPSPAPELLSDQVTVEGVRARAEIRERRSSVAVVRLTAHNPSNTVAAVRLRVGLARADGMRMDRVVTPPQPVSEQLVALSLEPGARVEKAVRIALPPNASSAAREFAFVAPASAGGRKVRTPALRKVRTPALRKVRTPALAATRRSKVRRSPRASMAP